MDYFISNQSLKLFDRFEIIKSFLETDIREWKANKHYLKGLKIFKELSVVNDVAERAVHIAEEYLPFVQDEMQKQYVLQVVTEYKKLIQIQRNILF